MRWQHHRATTHNSQHQQKQVKAHHLTELSEEARPPLSGSRADRRRRRAA